MHYQAPPTHVQYIPQFPDAQVCQTVAAEIIRLMSSTFQELYILLKLFGHLSRLDISRLLPRCERHFALTLSQSLDCSRASGAVQKNVVS